MLCPTLVPCLRLCSQTCSSLSWRICESFKSEWWIEVLRGEIAAFVLKAGPLGPTTPSLVQTQGTCHQGGEQEGCFSGAQVYWALYSSSYPQSQRLGQACGPWLADCLCPTVWGAAWWCLQELCSEKLWRSLDLPGVGSRDKKGS